MRSLPVLFLLLAASAVAQVCTSVTLSDSGAFATAAGGNSTFRVTASTPSNCVKTAVSQVPWIAISFGGGTALPNTFGYTVSPNPSPQERTGTVIVGPATFTVTQAGAACNFQLSPNNASFAETGGSGSVSVNVLTGCAWNATSNASWIAISSGASGSGPGTVTYTVEPNTGSAGRSGALTIGSATFAITQSAPCIFTLLPSSVNLPAQASTGTISVTANSGTCVRTAISTVPWITISSGASGTGNGTVSYSVQANTTSQSRSGAIQISGATFSVVQSAANCSYTVQPPSVTVPAIGESGTFTLTTTCAWTAASTADWLTVTSSSSGEGNAIVRWVAGPNPSSERRTASITAGAAAFVVVQEGITCRVSIAATGISVPAAGQTALLDVDAVPGCAWTAVPSAAWIRITAGASGSGPGSISFSIAQNTAPSPRTGAIVISNQTFTVTQAAASCEFSLSPSGTTVPAAGGTFSFLVVTTCSWTASSNAGWLTIAAGESGTGNGTVQYRAAANPSAQARSGTIRVGNLSFTVTQTGITCTLSLSPASASMPPGGGSGRIVVTGSAACSWTPVSDSGWLRIPSWSSVAGSGSIEFAVDPNPDPSLRAGSISVASETFSVSQAGAAPSISAQGVVNAASFRGGAVAPGEIVTIFGFLIGPPELATFQVAPDGQSIGTRVAGTRVLFDELEAPILYAVSGQVSAVVPYAVAGRPSVRVMVEHNGRASNAVTVPVAAVAPGLFSLDSSGAGAAAALNQNLTLNTAANPAQRGQFILLFGTGEGVTDPPGQDGRLTGTVLPRPVTPISVRIGGLEAEVQYAGAAPGLVAGVIQINARVPLQVPPGGAVPVVVSAGGVESQPGLTIAVR